MTTVVSRLDKLLISNENMNEFISVTKCTGITGRILVDFDKIEMSGYPRNIRVFALFIKYDMLGNGEEPDTRNRTNHFS